MSENLGCLAALFGIFGGKAGTAAGAGLPKVMVNNRFITGHEISFFHVLRHVVGERGYVLAQVSLRQLLFFPGSGKSNPGRQTWENKVARRAIDFVICNPRTLRPMVAIELDDSSHASARRESRDEEVERVLDAAGLPLVRVLASRSYDTRELAATILPHLSATTPPAPVAPR